MFTIWKRQNIWSNFLFKKSERSRIFGRTMSRYKVNNKMDLKGVACVIMDCILDVQNGNRL
jgi:hypothetical protein